MSDYSKLVKALRHCSGTPYARCSNCPMHDKGVADYATPCGILSDAAAAIEDLQAQLPKLGKWVEDTTTYAGPGLSNYKCSLCGKICGTWRRGLEPSELPNWCGNCGADMRAKMEVQE